MEKILVGIVVGSDSDLAVIADTAKILDEFGVAYTVSIASAHRTPDKVHTFITSCQDNGAKVFIAAAGMAAALPGVVASATVLPVIGVPILGKTLDGMDALLSIVQMPPGIPVATVAIGSAGAKNAALLALVILATSDASIKAKLIKYRKKMSDSVKEKDDQLQKNGIASMIAKK